MKRLFLASILAAAALSVGACAHHADPSSHHAADPHAPAPHAAAPHAAAPLGGPASRVLDLPGAPGAGDPREVLVLVDEPALKLASIVLRGGTVLPSHSSEVPVTLVALQGSGTVVAGADRLRLDPTHAIVLAPNVPHAVEPDPGTDLVVLVHHLGQGAEHHQ